MAPGTSLAPLAPFSDWKILGRKNRGGMVSRHQEPLSAMAWWVQSSFIVAAFAFSASCLE